MDAVAMNSRERAIRAIEHREPDRVPLEGTAWAEWSHPFLLNLLERLRLGSAQGKSGMLGSAEELDRLAETLGTDFRAVSMDPPTQFQRRAVCDPMFHQPWGLRVSADTLEDEWGIRRQLNATKTQSRIVYHPLQGKESLDDYSFPDPDAEGRFDGAEKLLKNWRDKYLVSSIWGGDSFFCQAWYLRGFTQTILDMHSDNSLMNELLDNLLKIFLKATDRFAEMGVDIIAIADDIAAQTGLIISPPLWRRHIKPRMKTIIESAKKKGVYVLYHTDGNCEPIIPDLIEIGVDILNPIQPECMDPAKIKEQYGEKLTLSGTISIQDTLPRGTVEDVRSEVKARIRTCGQGGGLIISPSNQVLLDTKVENFLAIYDAVREFGQYPLKF